MERVFKHRKTGEIAYYKDEEVKNLYNIWLISRKKD